MKFEEIIDKCPLEIKEIIEQCKLTPQSSKWHPEAPNDLIPHNVYKHIKIVYNRALQTTDNNLIIAALFHDLGKCFVTKPSEKTLGSWTSYGHEIISAKLVKKYIEWIRIMEADWFEVYKIVKEHMRIKKFNEMKSFKQNELLNDPLYKKYILFLEFDDMQTLTEEELNS